LVGGSAAIHDGEARPWALVVALVGVSLLLIGVNLANDYFDYRSGADPPLGVGPRPLQQGFLAPRTFLIGSIGAIGLAGVLGLALIISSPIEALLIGCAGALLGFFYTAPPLRLGYRGLGEVVVFLGLGPGACLGTYLVTAGRMGWTPVLASLPIGFTVTALLHANNLRDLDEDARSGKRTLAVRLGFRGAVREYVVLLAGAAATTVAVAVFLTPFASIALLVFPVLWTMSRQAIEQPVDGRALMLRTSSVHLRLATLLAIGLTVGGIVR
jgi:1,4-dihydroxy-2-naphthoate octaprenyltransferase